MEIQRDFISPKLSYNSQDSIVGIPNRTQPRTTQNQRNDRSRSAIPSTVYFVGSRTINCSSPLPAARTGAPRFFLIAAKQPVKQTRRWTRNSYCASGNPIFSRSLLPLHYRELRVCHRLPEAETVRDDSSSSVSSRVPFRLVPSHLVSYTQRVPCLATLSSLRPSEPLSTDNFGAQPFPALRLFIQRF